MFFFSHFQPQRPVKITPGKIFFLVYNESISQEVCAMLQNNIGKSFNKL
jgi:hypothetical protein